MTFTEEKILQSAITTFGADAQIDMMIEEMAELTKALLKLRRACGSTTKNPELIADINSEIADVSIVLDQMTMIFSQKEVSEYRGMKVARLASTILMKQTEILIDQSKNLNF